MMPDVFVRARDGALYRNPSLSFREGYVSFPGDGARRESALLVLWAPKESRHRGFEAIRILNRVMGSGWMMPATRLGYFESDREVPGSSPPSTHPALLVPFELIRRIPRPQLYDEIVKHASRVRSPDILIDLPPHPDDIQDVPI